MKNLSKNNIANTIVFFAILLGGWLRLAPAMQAGFPINDGGMFYTMVGDLHKNGYALPAFTSYNAAENIPFAYPPFPLYLTAAIENLFHLPVTQTLLWLPALTSIAVIVAFYFLSKAMLASEMQAAFAALFFALIPRTFSWFLMGGGLTRSFGQLFLMLTALSAYRMFTDRKPVSIILTILAGTLAVLSHPEAAIHTVGVVLLIWGFKVRNKVAFLRGVIVALGVGAATAIWWGPVVSQHGLAPFLNAAQTGNHSIGALVSLLTFRFTEEPLLDLMAVIGLIGLFVSLGKGNYFFAAWFVLPFILEPRSAPWIVTMPLAMLTGIALTDLLLPGLAALDPNFKKESQQPLQNRLALLFLGSVMGYSLLASYAFSLKMGADHLSKPAQATMQWVAENTPAESRFILLTGAQDTMHDPAQEWFPALAGRNSQTTLQGKEWTWGARFLSAISVYQTLQSCISSDMACVEQKAEKLGLQYDYIYIASPSVTKDSPNSQILIDSIKKSGKFHIVYEKGANVIFAQKKQ